MKKIHRTIGEAPAGKYTVPVVRSTFRILEELSRAEVLGLSEVVMRTRIAKSTAFRILSTLAEMGYVFRDADRNYVVGAALAQLASSEANNAALRKLALQHMLDLRNQFGETVNLGVLNFDKVTYLEVVPSEFALRMQETRGASVPMHASALGKAILAFSPQDLVKDLVCGRKLAILTPNTICDPDELLAELKRVRGAGYAVDRGETSLLARCVAAPVVDSAGMAIAAISISGPASRFTARRDSPAIAALLRAAAEISAKLQAKTESGAEKHRRSADLLPPRARRSGARPATLS